MEKIRKQIERMEGRFGGEQDIEIYINLDGTLDPSDATQWQKPHDTFLSNSRRKVFFVWPKSEG